MTEQPQRQFPDMWVDPDDDPRDTGITPRGEKEDPAKVIRLSDQATDAPLALLEKNADVRVLILSGALVNRRPFLRRA